MTEDQLREATGLVAYFHRGRAYGWSAEHQFEVQRRLLVLGVKLDSPVPDPRAPDGGSTVALAA